MIFINPGINIGRVRNKNSIKNEKRSRMQEKQLSDGLLTPIGFIQSITTQVDVSLEDESSIETEEVYTDESKQESTTFKIDHCAQFAWILHKLLILHSSHVDTPIVLIVLQR